MRVRVPVPVPVPVRVRVRVRAQNNERRWGGAGTGGKWERMGQMRER